MKTKKKTNRQSNRKLLCDHQTPRNQPAGLTCRLAVNNTIIPPQPVFGHALPCHSCETSVKENVRGERVPLMPSTDRRQNSSRLWEQHLIGGSDETVVSATTNQRKINCLNTCMLQTCCPLTRATAKKKETALSQVLTKPLIRFQGLLF